MVRDKVNFIKIKNFVHWDFPGGPLVKTPCSQCRGMGSIPGWRTKIPHALWCGQNKQTNKQKLLCIKGYYKESEKNEKQKKF